MTSSKQLFHPLTGQPIVPIGYGRRGPIWPILGGSEPPPAPAPAPPNAPPPSPTPPAAPPGNPPAGDPAAGSTDRTFTQADLDRIVGERIARERQKTADYDDLKRKADDFDRLQRERETETEKAVREAKEQGLAEARAEVRPGLVAAEFRAAAAGRIGPDRLITLTDDIDMSRYLRENGTVDVDKVAAKVTAWAPDKEPPRVPRPDPSQGARGAKTTSGIDAGREMFEARSRRRLPT